MVAATKFQYSLPTDLAQHFEERGGIDLAHSYRAEKKPDGTYTIKDIDIFYACQRKNPKTGHVDDFNDDWLEGAVRTFAERKGEGYLPPVHVDHHGKDGESRPFAGLMTNLRKGQNSKGVATLFADIGNIPAEVFAQITSMRLPFRSVEINRPDTPEISSLALMSTTVPYFKSPITRVSFSDDEQRICFCDYGGIGKDPETGGESVITQRFDAKYQPMSKPTLVAQKFMGGGHRYASDEDDDTGMDGEDPNDFPPDAEGGDDGMGGEELGPEELDELLASILADGGMDDGGMEDDPEMAGLAAEQGITEDEMSNVLNQLQETMGQMAQGLQNLDNSVKSLAERNADHSALPSPPPSVASDDTDDQVQFKDAGSIARVGGGKMPVWAEALRDDIKAVKEENKSLGEMVRFLFFEREKDALHFSVEDQIAKYQRLMLDKGYSERQVKDATKVVFKHVGGDVAEWERLANEDWEKAQQFATDLDVGTHFNEYCDGLTPETDASTSRPPDAPTSSAAPKGEPAVNPDVSSAKKWAESHDMAELVQTFGEENFAEAYQQFSEEYETASPAQRAFVGATTKDKFLAAKFRKANRAATGQSRVTSTG